MTDDLFDPPADASRTLPLPRGVVANGRGFMARIVIGGRRVSLGTYPTPDEASRRYEETRDLFYEEKQ